MESARDETAPSFAMDLAVAFPTQGDEILFGVMAQPTSGHDVVHFESRT